MDLSDCMPWKGRRVWLLFSSATTVRRYGKIVHVYVPILSTGEVSLAVRLDDGAVTGVDASDKGRYWDLAE
jgi:hypothetical protein